MSMTMAMRQRSLVLILARDLADKLASAAFIVDERGTLVYFNERCGELLGISFAEAGALPIERWSVDFRPCDMKGRPLPPEQVPLVEALQKQAPVHRKVRIQGMDGEVRDIAVTALPLFAHAEDCVGAVALFWEHAEPSEEA
jgi:PAS domain-containing protein